MSEITKLYENANIEKEVIKGCYEYYAGNGGIDIYTVNDCKNKDCNTCKADKSIKEYPPFTAEKQIELIKWLSRRYIEISNYDAENGRMYNIKPTVGNFATSFNYDFSECIAGCINQLWQDLTEEEKEALRGILRA